MVYCLDCPECRTVNYLDPFYFWYWEGKVKCAGCDTVYRLKFYNGELVGGPAKTEEEADVMPLYADKPLEGFTIIDMGTPGKTRSFTCLERPVEEYTGTPKRVTKSIRGKPVRGCPQKPVSGLAGTQPFHWEGKESDEKLMDSVHPDVREEAGKDNKRIRIKNE